MKRIILTSVASLVALTACGGGDDGATATDVWSRVSAPGQTQGVVYFDLTVPDDDTLVGVAVSSDIAGSAEIHEILEAEGNDDATDDMSGEMSGDMEMSEDAMDDTEGMSDDVGSMDMGAMIMQEMEGGLPLTGGETVSLAPGGYHVMLNDLVDPLAEGDSFEVTLDFANADDLTIESTVSETAP